jgi:hypothetical protein
MKIFPARFWQGGARGARKSQLRKEWRRKIPNLGLRQFFAQKPSI